MIQPDWEVALLALTLWREARGESVDAQRAVGWSIRNRVTKGGWFGDGWAAVLSKPFQYSSLAAPGDANLVKWPEAYEASWQMCMAIATEIHAGEGADPTQNATHYFSQNEPPLWAYKMRHTVDVGAFHFYEQI